jgi:tetratricopeptide (TPR) repeat protein
MAEKENQTIEYTPEELEEINRILDVVESRPHADALDITAQPSVSFVEPEDMEDADEGGGEPPEEIPEEDLLEEGVPADDAFTVDMGDEDTSGMPEDLSLPEGELDIPDVGDDLQAPGDEAPLGEDLDLSDLEEPAGEDVSGFEEEDEEELPQLEGDQETDSIEDITDLITEVPGEEEPAAPEDTGFEEAMPEEPGEEFEPVDLGEELDFEEPAFEEPDETGIDQEFEEPAEAGGSTLDQLNTLTREEPESVDEQDISDEAYTEDEPAAAPVMDESEDMEEGPVSLESDDSDVPDLSDLALQEASEMEEAEEGDIPELDLDEGGDEEAGLDEIDLGDEGLGDEGLAAGLDDLEDLGDDFIQPLDEAGEQPAAPEGQEDEGDEPEIDLEGLEGGPEEVEELETPVDLSGEEGGLTVEPLDEEEEPPPVEEPAVSGPADAVELSEDEMRRLKKALGFFSPGLVHAIKDTVINDLLPARETRQLVDMILGGKPEGAIQRFLEKRLETKIDLGHVDQVGRKVIHARPEYTAEGRDRQRRLLRVTKIFGAATAAALVLTILGYQYVYKPWKAKQLIDRGVTLIDRPGDYTEKPADYETAEKIFERVDSDYRSDYIYGYTEYGRAYFRQTEYMKSLDKLNQAYRLEPADTSVLNNLGRFYARVPEQKYRAIRDDVPKWYYPGDKQKEKDQLDVAIDMYRRTLAKEDDNITALLGIGDAYFQQGRYLDAKQYYENILKVDSDSVAGHAGLLNLYIERDTFPQVAGIHAQLREKDILEEVPSPLLGKLAEYYLSKNAGPGGNVRIDHGVVSPRLIDKQDNTYPAVRSVLRALNERDPDYPPLYVHSARLSREQKNYPVMKRHLEKALKLSPDYYGALHLMGEYNYLTNDMGRAYTYLRKALKAHDNQPAFTKKDFYRETEHIGHTHALMGNIFYYSFDQVKSRFGDLQEDISMAGEGGIEHFEIARRHYREAVESGFTSPEVHYNLGRIYYMNEEYSPALRQWLNLYDEYASSPELMLALGNGFYHVGKYDASKGEYLKLISVLERKAESIQNPSASREKHVRIFDTLGTAYNNLGAVYQNQEDESRSHISYWKGIDYAKRVEHENEFARVNLARSFRPGTENEPILDESIPFSVEAYRQRER